MKKKELRQEIVALKAEVESLKAILGRCEARSTGVFKSRCDRAKGHTDSHVSQEHGLVLWTNRP